MFRVNLCIQFYRLMQLIFSTSLKWKMAAMSELQCSEVEVAPENLDVVAVVDLEHNAA